MSERSKAAGNNTFQEQKLHGRNGLGNKWLLEFSFLGIERTVSETKRKNMLMQIHKM